MNFKKLFSIVIIAGVIFACDTPKKKEIKEVKELKTEKTEKVTLGATRFEEVKGLFCKEQCKLLIRTISILLFPVRMILTSISVLEKQWIIKLQH